MCSGFASSGVCANAILIAITSKEQSGAESIVYSAGTVTWSSSFTKPGFKNQTAPEQTITSCKHFSRVPATNVTILTSTMDSLMMWTLFSAYLKSLPLHWGDLEDAALLADMQNARFS